MAVPYRRVLKVTSSNPFAVEEAFDMIERPEIWSAVKHVADDLLRFGELDYEGIRDAVLYHDAIRHQTVADRL